MRRRKCQPHSLVNSEAAGISHLASANVFADRQVNRVSCEVADRAVKDTQEHNIILSVDTRDGSCAILHNMGRHETTTLLHYGEKQPGSLRSKKCTNGLRQERNNDQIAQNSSDDWAERAAPSVLAATTLLRLDSRAILTSCFFRFPSFVQQVTNACNHQKRPRKRFNFRNTKAEAVQARNRTGARRRRQGLTLGYMHGATRPKICSPTAPAGRAATAGLAAAPAPPAPALSAGEARATAAIVATNASEGLEVPLKPFTQ